MRLIKKGKEPNSLTQYKKINNAYYDGCNKADIRRGLLKEQGYLCAYCMRRISEENMTIEHYSTQSNISEKESLDYNNMLGVCLGNEGNKKKFTTCDEHRGNNPLTVNPFIKSSIDLIKYDHDGRIYSDDVNLDKDLNETLNLNCEAVLLKINRRKTLEALKNYLSKKQSRGDWKREFLERINNEYENFHRDGKLKEYSGIVLYYLNKRIQKL